MTGGVASRRSKTGQRRDHRVGPLRLNNEELLAVTEAANRAGLSLGAYATDAVVRTAHTELVGLPLGQLQEVQDAVARLQAASGRHLSCDDPLNQLARMVADVIDALRHFERD